jgi:prolyl-tRNA synthetase
MRGREFIMKDAYSFDRDQDGRQGQLPGHGAGLPRIFDRFGLRYRAVAADSGAIGGDLSEEFQVIAATGEDAIVYCPGSDYAANMEKAEALAPQAPQGRPRSDPDQNADAGQEHLRRRGRSCWACRCSRHVKSLVLATDRQLGVDGGVVKTQVWLLLLRGDHDMNEVKVARCRGWTRLPLCHRRRDRRPLSAASQATWARSGCAAGHGRRRPRSGRHGRLDLRRQ